MSYHYYDVSEDIETLFAACYLCLQMSVVSRTAHYSAHLAGGSGRREPVIHILQAKVGCILR